MPWGTVAVQKGKECHSLIEDIEIPAADSALGARFFTYNDIPVWHHQWHRLLDKPQWFCYEQFDPKEVLANLKLKKKQKIVIKKKL